MSGVLKYRFPLYYRQTNQFEKKLHKGTDLVLNLVIFWSNIVLLIQYWRMVALIVANFP